MTTHAYAETVGHHDSEDSEFMFAALRRRYTYQGRHHKTKFSRKVYQVFLLTLVALWTPRG